VRFGSRQCALVSISYKSYLDCHGRGRGFELSSPPYNQFIIKGLWHIGDAMLRVVRIADLAGTYALTLDALE
jgi:hypothetical protein